MNPTLVILNAFEQANPAIPRMGMGPYRNHPYFFIPDPARSERGYRHAKCYRGTILDYTVRGTKAYASLGEWAEDCGSSFEHIRYGFDAENFPSITVTQLLALIQPEEARDPAFEELEKNLAKVNLGFNSLYVSHNNNIIRAATFNLSFIK